MGLATGVTKDRARCLFLQNDRHRAIVVDFDQHVGPESAVLLAEILSRIALPPYKAVPDAGTIRLGGAVRTKRRAVAFKQSAR